jgi:Holliday junction resolvase
MRFETFSALTAISRRWPFDYGKIVQLLLAISFDPKRGGFSVKNYSSEGVDLEMVRDQGKFAVEVKTTEGPTVKLSDKDISGLQRKATIDKYTPVVAALQLNKSSDWVIADAARLEVNDYTPSRLSLDSIPELELLAKAHFERTVIELRDNILSPPDSSPLGFLSNFLWFESQ